MENHHSLELATFAGGCFWCMVKPFDELPGIASIVSGYTGGHTENPTYDSVGTETTGHYEAVQITFDPEVFPYERLLDLYWRQIDPTDAGGQFLDRGSSYKTAIFVHNEGQRRLAEASKREQQASRRFKGKIVTEILPAGRFYPAEDEHQAYYKTHPFKYKQYYQGSGRNDYVRKHWNGERERQLLRSRLTEQQYKVTQLMEQEPPYQNEYWDNKREGIYVDVVDGTPLFSSKDQFPSPSGWPAFSKPLEEGFITREGGRSEGKPVTLLRSRLSGAYLGRLLFNGPEPEKLHYSVNSAALRFIPKEDLAGSKEERYASFGED